MYHWMARRPSNQSLSHYLPSPHHWHPACCLILEKDVSEAQRSEELISCPLTTKWRLHRGEVTSQLTNTEVHIPTGKTFFFLVSETVEPPSVCRAAIVLVWHHPSYTPADLNKPVKFIKSLKIVPPTLSDTVKFTHKHRAESANQVKKQVR